MAKGGLGMSTSDFDPVKRVGLPGREFQIVPGWPMDLPSDRSYVEVVAAACDAAGHVYVFNRGPQAIIVFDPQGQYVRSLSVEPFARPHGITIAEDGTIYCVDDFAHQIRVLEPDGSLRMTMGTGQPSDTGADSVDYRNIARAGAPFNYPTNLAIAPNGDLFVTDGYGNARVHQFSAEGQHRASWGGPGSGPGQFQVPHGIAIDESGIVYVADRENSRIQRFDLTGAYLDEWTDVVRPCEVFTTGRGEVYVAELGERAGRWPGWPPADEHAVGGRVSVFDLQGKLVTRWGDGADPCAPGDFFAPHDICVGPDGEIYVSEVVWAAGARQGLVSVDCHTIQKFSPT